MKTPSAWRNTPLKSRIIFLLAVFFVFVGIAVANDTIDMGRQPPVRFAVSAVLSGLFAVCYAVSGVRLRGKFWKAFVPLFVLQFVTMGVLGAWFPDASGFVQLNAVETARLHNRLALDGAAIIVSVCLGYVGFIWVSICEGRRYIRTETEKALLESEMAAAREVQRVMVPEQMPIVSGYSIESIYRPAAEVGGDFFQVIPLQSGRTLVVIGDVSGKGLSAAMIVSMIVGILRTLTGYTEDPAEILTQLNRRQCGRADRVFATCIAVRIDGNGRLVMANAGHLPPYRNGAEIPLAGSLPLGLVEDADYEPSFVEMSVGDRVVLVTDGIAEARDAQGELLGFTRVESLLSEGASARNLVEAAQQHGQNDDMTVISIVREA
jgi:hypothetical protein